MASSPVLGSPMAVAGTAMKPRRFEFDRDSFAFANDLVWEYRFDPASGKTAFARRDPTPDYAHRCFVLARAARQFLYHARFDASRPAADDESLRSRVREIISRNPRVPCAPSDEVIVPGHANLREFSQTHERLLKSACGGAWQSYVLRSHWRMVFPISRRHQARTVEQLAASLRQGFPPIIHLVRFPSLSINHGMVVFDARPTAEGFSFGAYDPNDPGKPACLSFHRRARTFFLPANPYWAGGPLNVIEIHRNWLF